MDVLKIASNYETFLDICFDKFGLERTHCMLQGKYVHNAWEVVNGKIAIYDDDMHCIKVYLDKIYEFDYDGLVISLWRSDVNSDDLHLLILNRYNQLM